MTHPLSKPTVDLTGQRFGRLTAHHYSNANDGRKAWSCVCDCGAQIEVRGEHLRRGKSKSCGCLKKEKMAAGLATTHGMHKSAEFKTWSSMIERCTNPNSPSFERYGRRGITVSDRWLNSFEAFYADMGARPSGKTLDRRDNNSGYSKENCRWATSQEQMNNVSTNRKALYQGKEYTARELSDLTGAPYERLRCRLFKYGWSVERAISEKSSRDARKFPFEGKEYTAKELAALTGANLSGLRKRLFRNSEIMEAA
jgi:hypothetical protein